MSLGLRINTRSSDPVPVDIAPMIDVVFQLLIFFMLTSSFVLHPGIRVTLPKASTGETAGTSDIVVTLTKDHVLSWNDEVVTVRELRGRLERAARGSWVVIRADRHAYVEKLIEIWDLCRAAGLEEVHIATVAE